jgi:hypothetical protein
LGGAFGVLTRLTQGGRKATIQLSRYIIDAPAGLHVDHINRNPLDNRKKNLRLVTNAQNMQNTGAYRTSSTGEKNVYWVKCKQRFLVMIQKDGRNYYFGRYTEIADAIDAARKARASFCTHSPEATSGRGAA